MRSPYTRDQELIEQINSTPLTLEQRIAALEAAQEAPVSPLVLGAIKQLLDNTDFSWSKLAYLTAGTTPATVGDMNFEAYNWFRQLQSDPLVFDAAHALKSSGHSLFAANEGVNADIPRWNRVDGWGQMGSVGTNWDIGCPLPTNFVTPSQRFYFQCLVRLRTDTPFSAVKLYAGFFDNTPGIVDWIRSGSFPLSASVYGPTGSTTIAYKLIVTTDSGDTVSSTTVTITNAPASLSGSNGVALSWPRYGGFTTVAIYKTVSGVSYLVFTVGDGANAFNDVGQFQRVVDSVPSGVSTARAYAETRVFNPSSAWAEFDLGIPIPPTYNFSLTTGNQCLRVGLTGATGEGFQVEIDRVGISSDWGLWAISDRDKNAASQPSTSQTSSTQGPPSGGGDPPDDGGGGERGGGRILPL